MTSFTKNKVYEKLEKIKEYLGYLHQLKNEAGSETNFVSDFHLFGNTERYLQLAIQAISDANHLVIIDLGLPRPADNYEAVSILFNKKVISGELADKLTAMVGLRNILVHEYGKIDRARIYQILTTQLEDIEKYQNQVLAYINNPDNNGH